MHTPYFINKKLMKDLKSRFYDEFDVTASHNFRHPEDMQLSFSYFHYISSVRVYAPTSFQAWYAAFQTITNPKDFFLFGRTPEEEFDRVELIKQFNFKQTTEYQILKNCAEIFVNPICKLSTIETCASFLKSNSSSEEGSFNNEKITATYCQNTMDKVLPTLRLPIYDDIRGSKEIVEFKIIEGDDEFDLEQLQDTYFHRKKFVTINDDMPDEGTPGVEELIACMYKAFLPDPSPFENINIPAATACSDWAFKDFLIRRTPAPTRVRARNPHKKWDTNRFFVPSRPISTVNQQSRPHIHTPDNQNYVRRAP